MSILVVASVATAFAASEPMLDGRCDDHRGSAVDIGRGATMRVTQTRHHVWICIGLPPGSFGSTDLELRTSKLEEGINLHASAQLGEWPSRPGAAPTSATDPLWWSHVGWSANVVRFNGMDGTRPRFKPAEAREFQLSKSRFGRGVWQIRLTIHDLGGTAANDGPLQFPASPGDHKITVR